MVWVCLSLLGLAFLIALPMSWLVRYLSFRLGLVDHAGAERHKAALLPGKPPVPNTGGVALFTAVAWPMLAILLGVWLLPESFWLTLPRGGEILAHVPGLRDTSRIGGGVLAALAVVHVLGLYDDRRALGPGVKLGVQLAVAAGLVLFCDIRVLSFLAEPAPGHAEDAGWIVGGVVGWAAMFLLSLAWIVVITNAMNFMDNMDGLAAGVGLIAAGLYLAATLIAQQWFVAACSALLVGSLAGFWFHNLPPARLYLGDGGSLVLGLMLAVISVRTTYTQLAPPAGLDTLSPTPIVGPAVAVEQDNLTAPKNPTLDPARVDPSPTPPATRADPSIQRLEEPTDHREASATPARDRLRRLREASANQPGSAPGIRGAWYGILMPLLVLAVPLYDFTSVTLIRLRQGKSPFHGDHNHFSHRLLRQGFTKPNALVIILLASLATGLGGVMLGQLAGWQAGLVALQAAAVLTLLALLESAGRRPR